jgi:short subunit dehydrogenase-like uncharacterized protein
MVAEQLLARGLPVRAAARSEEKLAALAERLPTIECVKADVADPPSVLAAARGCSMLITTVGPYTRFGSVAVDAALAVGIPYIDIAGEPEWLWRVFDEYSPRAVRAGSPMLPAFGYDYVPGNLAGAVLLERCGEQAVRLDIAYCLTGENRRSTESFSHGTLDSLEASRGFRPLAFVGGRLRETTGPRRSQNFEVDGEDVQAVAIGGSEQYTLPRLAPWLVEINVGLGWFSPGEQRESAASADPDGPTQASREAARARIIALARDASGEVIAVADVDGPNPYDMSGLLCGWAAERILAGEIEGVGALGPVDAFGLTALRTGCAELGLTVAVS